MGTELTVMQPREMVVRGEDEFPVERLVQQKAAIQRAMQAVMKEGEHYGVIPGTEKKDKNGNDISKPSLLQPGADTLSFLFRLEPEYSVVDKEARDDLVSYDLRCVLRHIDTGRKWGEGMGSCNSREKRYQAQSTAKVCPKCNKPTIIKGKAEYGGGWICFEKKGGCKAKWPDGAQEIEAQEGQTQATGVWDLKNTILKMACKRARVAAVLAATAASDCFTQDLEDLVEHIPAPETSPSSPAASAVSTAAPTTSAPSTATAPATSPTDGKGVMGLADATPDVEPIEREEFTEKVPIFNPTTGEEVGRSPGITSAQNAHIHAMLKKLGHHMDEFKRGSGKQGEILHLGKYRKKLKEKYSKEHTNELSIIEAGWVIEWLLKCCEKMEKAMDRGTEPQPAPEPAAPAMLKDAVREQLGALMSLTAQLGANGHKGVDAQVAWCAQTLGRPLKAGTDMTTAEIARCLAVAEGQV